MSDEQISALTRKVDELGGSVSRMDARLHDVEKVQAVAETQAEATRADLKEIKATLTKIGMMIVGLIIASLWRWIADGGLAGGS